MAKPTCLKCSAVAVIGGMCSRCWRNSQDQPTRETSFQPTPRPVSNDETGFADLGIQCAADGCTNPVPKPKRGPQGRFCGPTCRLRTHRTT